MVVMAAILILMIVKVYKLITNISRSRLSSFERWRFGKRGLGPDGDAYRETVRLHPARIEWRPVRACMLVILLRPIHA